MKRVYLVRHGKAEEYDPDRHESDDARALTGEGRDELRSIARKLRRIDPATEVVLTSPLRRARETAEILAKALDVKVEDAAELAPPVSSARLIKKVRSRPESRIALVGHEPGLGQTIARWLGLGDRSFPLRKGGIARLDVGDSPEEGDAELVWLATPELFVKRR
jgi:phosphohistidine phosphatase